MPYKVKNFPVLAWKGSMPEAWAVCESVQDVRFSKEGLINSRFHSEICPWADHQGECGGHLLFRGPFGGAHPPFDGPLPASGHTFPRPLP